MSSQTVKCRECGQALPEKRGRICGKCHRPIKRHDRWHTIGSVVQHKDCSDPELRLITLRGRVEQAGLLEEPQ